MSEEKKLSKDKRAFHWLHAWMRWYNVKFIPLLRLASPKKTKEALREQKEIYQHLKSLIESSGEPSRDKSLDAQYVKLLEETKRLGVGEKEFIEKILQSYKQEPSEAEVEEFVEIYVNQIAHSYRLNWNALREAIRNRLTKMLKEYRELLRRG